MSPDTAISLVTKYAKQYGVREAARIFKINASTVSRIVNDKGCISGLRIAAKVAAAGTFTCPTLGILMLPEICQEFRFSIERYGHYRLKPEHRRLYSRCPNCDIGERLCQAK